MTDATRTCLTPTIPDPSDRGFNAYSEFVDLNDNRIIVSRSSLAGHDAVRVYNYGYDGKTSCIHVCRQGARELRDALDRFLADEQWSPCDVPGSDAD